MPYNLTEFNEYARQSALHLFEVMGRLPDITIELGAFDGYFTIGMTHEISPVNPNYVHVSVDPYIGYNEYDQAKMDEVRDRFIKNIGQSPYRDHIQFMNTKSADALIELGSRGLLADLIYVDGDHRSSSVLEDLVLSWRVLRVGGAVLIDDSTTWCYTDDRREKPLQMSPRLAVDSFIHCNWDKLEVVILPNGYQTAFIKRVP